MDLVSTRNKWEVGERVAARDSAAVTPRCTESAKSGLIGSSCGGLDAVSGDVGLVGLRRFAAEPPGCVQPSTSKK